MLTVELKEVDNFESLQDVWNELLSKSLDNNPFSTYEWLSTWWKYYGKDKKLKIIIAKNENKVIFVSPEMQVNHDRLGVKILKKIEFTATPNSDYHTFILVDFEKCQKEVNFLVKNIYEKLECDVIIFGEIPETSYSQKMLQDLKISGYTIDRSICSPCPYIELPRDPESFLHSLGSSMRHNLRKWEKDASEKYKVNFISYKEIGNVEKAMNVFFDLHQNRQKSEGRDGYFSNKTNEQFHIEIAKAFAKKDYLGLFFLTFDDIPVSSLYSYEYNGKLYAYLCGFDTQYSIYRPGYLVFKKAIEYGINKGLREFDFLRGSEEYKTRWKAKVRNNYEYRIFKNGIKTKAYEYLKTHYNL